MNQKKQSQQNSPDYFRMLKIQFRLFFVVVIVTVGKYANKDTGRHTKKTGNTMKNNLIKVV